MDKARLRERGEKNFLGALLVKTLIGCFSIYSIQWELTVNVNIFWKHRIYSKNKLHSISKTIQFKLINFTK